MGEDQGEEVGVLSQGRCKRTRAADSSMSIKISYGSISGSLVKAFMIPRDTYHAACSICKLA